MAVMIVEWDIKLGSDGINYGCSNAEASKGTRSGHEGDFCNV